MLDVRKMMETIFRLISNVKVEFMPLFHIFYARLQQQLKAVCNWLRGKKCFFTRKPTRKRNQIELIVVKALYFFSCLCRYHCDDCSLVTRFFFFVVEEEKKNEENNMKNEYFL